MPTYRDLVVIGSSLGGPQALVAILGALPASFPAAILIAQHISPESPKQLARILSKSGPLQVDYGAEHEKIIPGKVYLAPPDLHMAVRSVGLLGLESTSKVHHSRPAATPLFESAAACYGPRVIGVVLTGGDGDGSDGLRAIAEVGGVGIVQDPAEARSSDMPLAAISSDHPSYIVPVEMVGPLLVRLTAGTIGSYT
jgi:two-component system chemotaxis response regulator CheB